MTSSSYSSAVVVLFLLLTSVSILLDTSAVQWSCLQVFKSIFKASFTDQISGAEEVMWKKWEGDSSFHPNSTLLSIPTYSAEEDKSSLRSINFQLPFLIQNISRSDVLTLNSLMTSPLRDLSIDYFSDARKILLVPDAHDSLGVIMENILSGGPQKIGTQIIIQEFPSILRQYLTENTDWLTAIFGINRVRTWIDLGVTITVPVFVSRGLVGSDADSTTTRTDLHCEPISNVVLQTAGEKKWTLVAPEFSRLLKPTVSPDGRAYFFSSVDPLNASALDHVPRYEVITKAGDLLYVPTWMWHKVEYLPQVTAVSMSIFQFLGGEFIGNNPLFALTILPNLFKEAVGLKTQ